jgi:hypothetical protein
MDLRTEIENIVHEILMEGVTKEDAVKELLNLHSVSKCTCEIPSTQTHWENNVIKWTCFKCKKPT